MKMTMKEMFRFFQERSGHYNVKMSKALLAFVLCASLCAGIFSYPVTVNAAGTETMYLVQNVTSTGNRTFNDAFSYNSNGLITNIVPQDYEQPFTCQYGKGLLKTVYQGGYSDVNNTQYNPLQYVVYNYKYDSKKRIVEKSSNMGSYRYTYNKDGKVIKRIYKGSGVYGSSKSTDKYTYNDDGRITEIDRNGTATITCTYDKYGNLKKTTNSANSQSKTYTNTYTNGRITKQKIKGQYETYTMTFSYKKVKVPKKYVSAVKEQQDSLLNQDMPPAAVNFIFSSGI